MSIFKNIQFKGKEKIRSLLLIVIKVDVYIENKEKIRSFLLLVSKWMYIENWIEI